VGSSSDKLGPERDQTDEGLRTERRNADRALSDRQAAVEEDADSVVRHARRIADAVLVAAREKADERLSPSASVVDTRATVAAERAIEDGTLRDERAIADETLRQERMETARALARLLPLERDNTDRYLLTERVRADDAVSNRDDFLGIVSHDLRNLLGGIVMNAELLSHEALADDHGQKTVAATARIQRYAARMNRLIGDLLDVASMDAGRLAVSLVAGDGAAIIAEAVDLFQSAASARTISLTAVIPEPNITAHFDHERILQVLANLITNALKFTPEGGNVSVHAERAGSDLRVRITDDGCGVSAGMLEAIFERFCQVGTNDRRGVGLGLYISKCIVLAHGGTIWAEPNDGAGTTVVFTLPCGEAVPVAA
jgi:signal transduction histidine kinase